MQPTVQSQARLKRVAWGLAALLVAVLIIGGVHVRRLGDHIAQLEEEARATAIQLGAARREAGDARQAAEAAQRQAREAADRAQAAEGVRAKLEALAKSTDAMRADLEGRLKAAEAAKAEAEAKLKAATEKSGARPEGKQE